jgi:hypothetical protein
VAYGAGRFVATTDNWESFTSPDGLTWTPGPSLRERVTYVNGSFVSYGHGGYLATSPDGLTWTTRTTGVATVIRSVCHGYAGYLLVGEEGVASLSADLSTWTPVKLAAGRNYVAAAVATSDRYVAVGESGLLITSP